jgi:uncharacterized protein YfiM (DUF2279 family)
MRAFPGLAFSCLFAVSVLVLWPASAAADDWLTPIKLSHLVGEGGVATIGAGMARGLMHADHRRAVWYGASAAVVVGGMKELYDWKFGETRRLDLRDLALDVAGAGIGVASTELTASHFVWPHLKTAGETVAATGTMMLASTLLTSVAALPWLKEEQRQGWYLPVGLVGAGGLVLLAGSHLVEYLKSR